MLLHKKRGAKEYIYIALYISVKKTRFFNKVINNTLKNLIQLSKKYQERIIHRKETITFVYSPTLVDKSEAKRLV